MRRCLLYKHWLQEKLILLKEHCTVSAHYWVQNKLERLKTKLRSSDRRSRIHVSSHKVPLTQWRTHQPNCAIRAHWRYLSAGSGFAIENSHSSVEGANTWLAVIWKHQRVAGFSSTIWEVFIQVCITILLCLKTLIWGSFNLWMHIQFMQVLIWVMHHKWLGLIISLQSPPSGKAAMFVGLVPSETGFSIEWCWATWELAFMTLVTWMPWAIRLHLDHLQWESHQAYIVSATALAPIKQGTRDL